MRAGSMDRAPDVELYLCVCSQRNGAQISVPRLPVDERGDGSFRRADARGTVGRVRVQPSEARPADDECASRSPDNAARGRDAHAEGHLP
jgi:hypothetical protein